MALTTEIIIGIIIAGLIYVFIHRTIVQRATRMVRRTAQDETDVAMTAAVQRLVNDGVLTVAESDLFTFGCGGGCLGARRDGV